MLQQGIVDYPGERKYEEGGYKLLERLAFVQVDCVERFLLQYATEKRTPLDGGLRACSQCRYSGDGGSDMAMDVGYCMNRAYTLLQSSLTRSGDYPSLHAAITT
jgi:hypothetical protein